MEVLASLLIFIVGVSAILNFFPSILRAEREAALMSAAAMLGQMKAAEVRRDNLAANPLLPLTVLIAQRTDPTPPIQFPREPRLAYSFHSMSLLDPVDDPGDATDDAGVARVMILRYDMDEPPTLANIDRWDILAEYRFDQGLLP